MISKPIVFRTTEPGILLPIYRLDIAFIVKDRLIYHINHDCFFAYIPELKQYFVIFGPAEDPETIPEGCIIGVHFWSDTPWLPPENPEDGTVFGNIKVRKTSSKMSGFIQDDTNDAQSSTDNQDGRGRPKRPKAG